MTGYNIRLRAPPRIRLVQANLGNIIPKAVCPAAKRAPFLCFWRSIPKLLKSS